MSRSLAFIGLGIMGIPMAGHLLSAGHTLRVNTRTKANAQALMDRGAIWANTPAEAAQDVEAVFICVTDTPDVEQVVLGNGGIAQSGRKGLIIIDHSTISPSVTKTMAVTLGARGMHLLDAPVSGGDIGAKNATLSIMVGGDEEVFERVKPLLALMGKTITHCGPSGAGQLTKLTNQILGAGTLLAVAEALAFARASGLDERKALAAIVGGAAGSWQLSNLGPKMLENDWRAGFMIDLVLKDLRLVEQSASENGIALPAVRLAQSLFEKARADGRGRDGTQAIITAVDPQRW